MRSAAMAKGSTELIDLQVTLGVFRNVTLNFDELQQIF